MDTQHVLAIAASDQLPDPTTLEPGYAILRDGITHVVRSAGGVPDWVQVIVPEPTPVQIESPGQGEDPQEPPTPTPLPLPSVKDRKAYDTAFTWQPLTPGTRTYNYDPRADHMAGTAIYRGQVLGSPSRYAGLIVQDTGTGTTPFLVSDLLLTRPGYYEVELQVLTGDPASWCEVVAYSSYEQWRFPAPAQITRAVGLRHRAGATKPFVRGVLYMGDRDGIGDVREQGGTPLGGPGDQLTIEMRVPWNGSGNPPAIDPGYRVSIRVRPILYTGPDNPPPLPNVTFAQGALSGLGAHVVVRGTDIATVVGGIARVAINSGDGQQTPAQVPPPNTQTRFVRQGDDWVGDLNAGVPIAGGLGIADWYATVIGTDGGAASLHGTVGGIYVTV